MTRPLSPAERKQTPATRKAIAAAHRAIQHESLSEMVPSLQELLAAGTITNEEAGLMLRSARLAADHARAWLAEYEREVELTR